MHIRRWVMRALILLLALPAATAPAGKVRNDKVLVSEQTLAPGETLSLPADQPAVLVYLDAGAVAVTPQQGEAAQGQTVRRGDAVYEPPPGARVMNIGPSPLRIVQTRFLGPGSSVIWGQTGLAPNYKVLFENQYARVYDIKIAAGVWEPQHTHHDRVVVCLSGAELEHILPDGRKENSSLTTDEIVWRRAATHVGHNRGKTDLWAIAIEPK